MPKDCLLRCNSFTASSAVRVTSQKRALWQATSSAPRRRVLAGSVKIEAVHSKHLLCTGCFVPWAFLQRTERTSPALYVFLSQVQHGKVQCDPCLRWHCSYVLHGNSLISTMKLPFCLHIRDAAGEYIQDVLCFSDRMFLAGD